MFYSLAALNCMAHICQFALLNFIALSQLLLQHKTFNNLQVLELYIYLTAYNQATPDLIFTTST